MADKCPSCSAPVDGSGKFQDLPPDKYPRSYSPNFEDQLAQEGAAKRFKDSGKPLEYGPVGDDNAHDYPHFPPIHNENLQEGERSLGQKIMRGAQQRAKK
jgi:hypothetical protein